MQQNNPPRLGPGVPRPAVPAPKPPTPSARADLALQQTVAFEQRGVPDAAPRAGVAMPSRPPQADLGGRAAAPEHRAVPEVQRNQTLAYDDDAYDDSGGRRTLGYEEGDLAAAAPAGVLDVVATARASGAATELETVSPRATSDALGVAKTIGVADALAQGLAPAYGATSPGAATAPTPAMPLADAPVVGSAAEVARGASVPVGARTEARSTVLPRLTLASRGLELLHETRLRYEPAGPLGEGGVGVVEKATDNDIGRAVAVKRLRPEQRGPSVVVRFVDEIRTIGQLEHPNIVPIHDVGIDPGGEYFFVMKYVDGETLETIIDRLARGDREAHRLYPFERRVEIFRDVLEAIRFAHARGVIHRDIKPANIMVGRYGEVVVLAWGLAKRVGEPTAGAVDEAKAASVGPGPGAEAPVVGPGQALLGAAAGPAAGPLGSASGTPNPRGLSRPAVGAASAVALRTQLGAVLGTPAYMSPEQARGEVLDARSDVYSLCLMLHELLCLRHPLADKQTLEAVIQGAIHEQVPMTGRVRSPHQPNVPMDLAWFVRKGVHKDPARRYQSVSEMIDRLELRSQGIIPIQCHLTFTKRLTMGIVRLSERFPLLFTLAMLVGLVGVVFSVVRLVL